MFDHVFVDVGLAVQNVGTRAGQVVAELLELAPFGSVLFSSDGYGLPELFHVSAELFRRALSDFLAAGVEGDAWSERDAERIAHADRSRRTPAAHMVSTTGEPDAVARLGSRSMGPAAIGTGVTRGQVFAWGLWDWGSAAFNAVILTFVFSVYLTDAVGDDLPGSISANTWLGWSLGLAGLLIAVLAPVTGQRPTPAGDANARSASGPR